MGDGPDLRQYYPGGAVKQVYDLIEVLIAGGGSGLGATGPTGANGNDGAAGAAGAAGPTGAAGAAGAAGTPGATGSTGSTGAAGAQGAAGTPGAAGATGPTGTQGTAGTAGAAGATGPTGAQGTAGTAGSAGAAGATGPTGAQGTAGTAGTAGGTGPTGPAGAGSTGFPTMSSNQATGGVGLASTTAAMVSSPNQDIPAGGTIIVFAAEDGTTSGGSVTDSAGNVYTAVLTINPNGNAANGFLRCYKCVNNLQIACPGTITYTPNSVGVKGAFAWYAISQAKGDLDATTQKSSTGTGTSISLASGIPTVAHEMLLAAIHTVSTGWAFTGNFATNGNTVDTLTLTAWQEITNAVAAPTAAAKTLTASSATTGLWCAMIVGVKP